MWKYIVYAVPIFLISGEIDKNIIKAQEPLFIIIDDFERDLVSNSSLLDCRDSCNENKKLIINLKANYLKDVEKNVSKEIMKDYLHQVETTNKLLTLKTKDQNLELLKKSFPNNLTLKNSYPNKETLQELIYEKGFLLDIRVKSADIEFRAIGSRKDDGYVVEPSLDLILEAEIYKFNRAKNIYESIANIEGKNIGISSTANIKALYSKNMFDSKYKSLPVDAIQLTEDLKNIFSENYKLALIELLKNIEMDDRFKSSTPLENIIGDTVKFKKLAKYGELKISSPLIFEIDDDKFAVGFVKNIVGDEVVGKIINRNNSDNNFQSVKVPYWQGYLLTGAINYGYSDIVNDGKKIAPLSVRVLTGGIVTNLGFIFNSKMLGDVWLRTLGSIGDQTADVNGYKNFESINFSYLYGYQIGLEYRYYPNISIIEKFIGGLYIDADLNLIGRFGDYDVRYFNQQDLRGESLKNYGDGKLSIFSHSLGLAFGLGSTISYNFGWFWKISYDFPVYQYSSLEQNGREINLDYMPTDKFGYGSTFRTSFGFDFNW